MIAMMLGLFWMHCAACWLAAASYWSDPWDS